MGRKQKKKKGGGGGKKEGRHKLFNRAYWKASQLQPGQKSTLTEEEDAELRRYLYPRPFQTVPCQICGHETHDRDRDKEPWNLPKGVRVCGPCLFGKDGKKFWTSLQQTFSAILDT